MVASDFTLPVALWRARELCSRWCAAPAVRAGAALGLSMEATKREKRAVDLFQQQDKKNAGRLKK